MRLRKNTFRRGFTLTELLVVLAIISLLATIAVPVYINRMQQARVAIARAEAREIASSQQQVGILHGFYVPIHLLNNIPDQDNTGVNIGNDADEIDEVTNAASHLLIDVNRPLNDQETTQLRLSDTTDARVGRMIQSWQGPFLNPQLSRLYFVGQSTTTGTGGDISLDIVLDPWGNAYRLYTPVGITGSSSPPTAAVASTQISLSDDDGDITNTERDRFDRYAIVSYGPDGVTGFDSSDPTDQGDDIVYTFVGVLPSESIYQGF